MDQNLLGSLIGVVKQIPDTAVSEAVSALEQAQEVKDSIPEDYTQLSGDVADLKSALSSADIYYFAKYGGFGFPPSTVVASNARAYIRDVSMVRFNKFAIHYPNTIKIYAIDEYYEGAWHERTGVTTGYTPTAGTADFIFIFCNKTNSNTDITSAELSQIYISCITTVDEEIAELQSYKMMLDGQSETFSDTITSQTDYDFYWDVILSGEATYKMKLTTPDGRTGNFGLYYNNAGSIHPFAANTLHEVTFGVDITTLRIYVQSATATVPGTVTLQIYNDGELNDIKADIEDLQDEIASLDDGGWYKNKKYVALGDSITWGYIPRWSPGYEGQLDSYAKLTAVNLGMTFVNFGRSGSTLASYAGTSQSMCDRFSSMPDDADVITVMGGTNDIRNANYALGTMADREPTTFYGGLHYLLSGLYKKYFIDQGTTIGKEKKIVVCTPIKLLQTPASTSGGNGTLVDMSAMCQAIKEVAAYYSFPVLDMQNLSNINPHIDGTNAPTDPGYTGYYNKYITDGTHPTQEGAVIMSKVLTGFLKGLV